MPKLVLISGKKLIHVLTKNGFETLRTNGSHNFLINKATQKTTTIPVHGKEDLGPGLLRQILRDINMTVEEYDKLRK